MILSIQSYICGSYIMVLHQATCEKVFPDFSHFSDNLLHNFIGVYFAPIRRQQLSVRGMYCSVYTKCIENSHMHSMCCVLDCVMKHVESVGIVKLFLPDDDLFSVAQKWNNTDKPAVNFDYCPVHLAPTCLI